MPWPPTRSALNDRIGLLFLQRNSCYAARECSCNKESEKPAQHVVRVKVIYIQYPQKYVIEGITNEGVIGQRMQVENESMVCTKRMEML